MKKSTNYTETPATKWLKDNKIEFDVITYDYVDNGGANHASTELGLDPHQVAKTLIMQDEQNKPLIIVMHGDKQVSTKNLAREIKAKKVQACSPDIANKNSGYLIGGTSPFATRKAMPIYIEAGLLNYQEIFINGGKRGLLLKISPYVLVNYLNAKTVNVSN